MGLKAPPGRKKNDVSKVPAMPWSCPYYDEDGMDPEDINETICPHFNTETLTCELDEPWLECNDYYANYGCDDFEEE